MSPRRTRGTPEGVTDVQDHRTANDESCGIVRRCSVGGRHVAWAVLVGVKGGREIVLLGSHPIPIDVRPCVAVG